MSNTANYGTMVDPDKKYPVSYTIKQDGTKVYENTWLLGKDLTENQIKQLIHFEMPHPELNPLKKLWDSLSEKEAEIKELKEQYFEKDDSFQDVSNQLFEKETDFLQEQAKVVELERLNELGDPYHSLMQLEIQAEEIADLKAKNETWCNKLMEAETTIDYNVQAGNKFIESLQSQNAKMVEALEEEANNRISDITEQLNSLVEVLELDKSYLPKRTLSAFLNHKQQTEKP